MVIRARNPDRLKGKKSRDGSENRPASLFISPPHSHLGRSHILHNYCLWSCLTDAVSRRASVAARTHFKLLLFPYPRMCSPTRPHSVLLMTTSDIPSPPITLL